MNTSIMTKGRLVLTRKKGEKILIGKTGEIVITLLHTPGYGVAKFLIEAPKDCPIWREELENFSGKGAN